MYTQEQIAELVSGLSRSLAALWGEAIEKAGLEISVLADDAPDEEVAQKLVEAFSSATKQALELTRLFSKLPDLENDPHWKPAIGQTIASFESLLADLQDGEATSYDRLQDVVDFMGVIDAVPVPLAGSTVGETKVGKLFFQTGVAITAFDMLEAGRTRNYSKIATGITMIGAGLLIEAVVGAGLAALGLAAWPFVVAGAAIAWTVSEFYQDEFDELYQSIFGNEEAAFIVERYARLYGGPFMHFDGINAVAQLGTSGNDVESGQQGRINIIGGGGGDDWLSGAELADVLGGGGDNDRLDGLAGDDQLVGGEGNDQLTGGVGNDSLEGGEGFDTYRFSVSDFSSSSEDIIIDSDGAGKIVYENIAIGDYSVNNVSRDGLGWETNDRVFRMQVVGTGDERSLVIIHRESGSRIVVKNWSNGALGITLPGLGQPGTPENPSLQTNGDDLFGYDGHPSEENPISGNDFVSGLAGNDGIDGGYGDDWIDGGHGSDLILGGPGSNRLVGGLGDDILISSAFVMGWDRHDYGPLVGGSPYLVSYGNGWFADVNSDEPYTGDAFQRLSTLGIVAWGYEGTDPNGGVWHDVNPDIYKNGADDIDAGDGSDTAYGGDGGDTIDGGTGNDLLVGGRDGDFIDGGGDDDLILGDELTSGVNVFVGLSQHVSTTSAASGNDVLIGGDGNDRVYGQGGNDVIVGGVGDDVLSGDRLDYGLPYRIDQPVVPGDDHIDGGAGNDSIYGDGGNDTLLGGAGIDLIVGDSVAIDGSQHGSDVVNGGDDADTVFGMGGNDTINGDGGDDLLIGDANVLDLALQFHGNDKMFGGVGNDELQGGGGDDLLDGGEDNDKLFGEVGRDRLLGGAGTDELAGGEDADSLDGGTGDDFLFGEAGADVLNGGLGNDQLQGGSDDDHLSGGNGQDTLYGQAGADHLLGEGGLDELQGGDGNDHLDGGIGNDKLWGDAGDDVLGGGDGNDELVGSDGNDVLDGGTGDDILNGSAGNDQLVGGAGNDNLSGNEHNDVLDGGVGNDSLFGGSGDDVLDGGAGNDLLEGGSGYNTYRYGMGYGHDVINADDLTATRVVELVNITGPQALRFDIQEGALVIMVGATGETLKIEGYLNQDGAPVRILFSDGSELPSADIWSGRNQIFLGGYDDRLIHGHGGDDWIWTGSGRDELYGDEGDDEILGGLNHDVIYGGTGDDLLYGDLYDINYEYVAGGDDILHGGQGNDAIYASSGNDRLYGGEGNDYLEGGSGNDYLDGGAGNDYLEGDNGSNTYVFSRGHGKDTVFELQGVGEINRIVYDATVSPSDIVVTRPTTGNEVDLVIAATGDRITLKRFDDKGIGEVVFADGTVWTALDLVEKSMQGTLFDDNLFGNYAPGDIIDAGAGNDRITTLDHDDTISGGAGNDVLKGGAGNDILDGGTGSDMLAGDAGNDRYRFGIGSGLDFINNGSGEGADYDAIELGGGIGIADVRLARAGDALVIDLIASGDRLVVLGHFSDIDSAYYGGAIDALHFGNGTVWSAGDILQHLGPDIGPISVRYENVQYVQEQGAPSYIIGAQGASGAYYGDQESATLFDVGKTASRMEGHSDVVMYGGNAGDTYVYGRGYGRHFILDTGGNDLIRFDADLTPADVTLMRFGNELVVQLSTEDTLSIQGYFAGANSVEAMMFADGTYWDAAAIAQKTVLGDIELHGSEDDDTLIGGAGNDRLYGQDGRDVLDGGARDDLLDGGAGADIMRGDTGSDTYIVDDVGDLVIESTAAASPVSDVNMVYSTVDYTLGDSLHWLFLEGNADLRGSGNLESNVLIGNAGNNVLTAAPEELESWNSDWIDGGAGNDILLGGHGDDTLVGGTGADVMRGGSGQDFYSVDNAGDIVIEEEESGGDGTGGQQLVASSTSLLSLLESTASDYPAPGDHPYREGDTVAASIDFTLGDNIESLLLLQQAVVGVGNGLDNRIDGNAMHNNLWGLQGDDRLWGDSGNDVLYGGDGSDSLEGGYGSDRLVGGDGSDFYSLTAGEGNDIIDNADAWGNDEVFVSGVSWDEVQFRREGGNLVLSMPDDLGSLTFTDWYADASNRVDYLYDTNWNPLAADDVDALIAGGEISARSQGQATHATTQHPTFVNTWQNGPNPAITGGNQRSLAIEEKVYSQPSLPQASNGGRWADSLGTGERISQSSLGQASELETLVAAMASFRSHEGISIATPVHDQSHQMLFSVPIA